jgi:hypothetical protein
MKVAPGGQLPAGNRIRVPRMDRSVGEEPKAGVSAPVHHARWGYGGQHCGLQVGQRDAEPVAHGGVGGDIAPADVVCDLPSPPLLVGQEALAALGADDQAPLGGTTGAKVGRRRSGASRAWPGQAHTTRVQSPDSRLVPMRLSEMGRDPCTGTVPAVLEPGHVSARTPSTRSGAIAARTVAARSLASWPCRADAGDNLASRHT